MVSLETFGGVRILDHSGEELRLRSRKHVALFVFLRANAERVHLRQELCDLFWDSEKRLARHSLSQALYDIRTQTGSTIQNCPGDAVRLVCDNLDYDAARLEAAIQTEQLREAVNIYKSPYCPDLDGVGTHAYEEWLERERGRLGLLAETALHRFAEHVDRQGRWGELCSAAARLISINPLNEYGHRCLMRGLWLSGNAGGALKHFDSILSSTELFPDGLEGETLRLADRIRDAKSLSGRDDLEPSLLPVTGREEEIAKLQSFLSSGRSDVQVVLVRGEPGIGKTRLMLELERLGTLAGFDVVTSRCHSAERQVAFGPVLDAFDSLISDVFRSDERHHRRYGKRGMSSERSDKSSERGADGKNLVDERRNFRRRLFEKVALAINEGISKERLWILEDLHWIDGASAALLHYLLRRLRDAPLLIALTMRPPRGTDSPALSLLASEYVRNNAIRIELGPLAPKAVHRLVENASGQSLREQVTKRIYKLSGGNPYYALEILAASELGDLVEQGARFSETSISTKLADVLTARTRGLSPEAVRMLEMLAVLVPCATTQTLSTCLNVDLDNLREVADELYRRGLVVDSGTGVEFAHEIAREFVYGSLGEISRVSLHRRVAETLASVNVAGPGVIARHFELGKDRARAYEYAIRAAAQALEQAAPEEAGRMASLALRVSGTKDQTAAAHESAAHAAWGMGNLDETRKHLLAALETGGYELRDELTIRLDLVDSLVELGQYDKALTQLACVTTSTEELASDSTRNQLWIRCLSTRLAIGVRSGSDRTELRTAAREMDSALSQKGQLSTGLHPESRAYALYAMAAYAGFYGSADHAFEYLSKAADIVDGMSYSLAQRLRVLDGGLRVRMAQWHKADVVLNDAASRGRQVNDPVFTSMALNNLACSALERGRWHLADSLLEQSCAVFHGMRISRERYLGMLINRANLEFYRGNTREAAKIYSDCLRELTKANLRTYEAEVRACLALIALQRSDQAAFDEHVEYLCTVNPSSLAGIQERFKVDWVKAIFALQHEPSGKVLDSIIKAAKELASRDLVSALKLEWICFSLSRSYHLKPFRYSHDAKPATEEVLIRRMHEAELYWFTRFLERWFSRSMLESRRSRAGPKPTAG